MKLLSLYVNKLSIRKKIQHIVLVCVALMVFVSFSSMHVISSSYQEALYQSLAGSLSSSSQGMSNQLDIVRSMADMLLADSIVQDNLSILKDSRDPGKRAQSSQKLYNTLNEYYFNFRNNHVRYISLYHDQFATQTYVAAITRLPDDVTNELITRAEAGRGAAVWVTDYSQEYGLFLTREIRQIQHLKLDSIGIMIINVDINTLIHRLTTTAKNYDFTHFLLYDKDYLIYDSAGLTKNPDFSFPSSFPSGYGRLKLGQKDYFYVHSTIADLEWDYICTIPYDTISNALSVSRNLCIGMIMATILISLLLSNRLIHSLTRHFDILLVKMQNFGDGLPGSQVNDFDYSSRKDELGQLHTQFDMMVDQVNTLIRSNYLNEILRKEAQLKALETQINPHFLYNTLESINWRAKALGARDISSMAESLGTLLRITLDQKTKTFPLYRELELIKSYMIIQQYRYEGRLKYEIDVPKNLQSCEVLKLTLQPLVENAIRYGLEENTETCRVQILAEVSGGFFYLYVKNNGSCFEENLLLKLETNEVSPNGFGIGLLNIHKRLQLTYGAEYGLTLYNEGELAVAKITLPSPYPSCTDSCP